MAARRGFKISLAVLVLILGVYFSASAEQGSSGAPAIGENAPAFKAETTRGPINFPEDYKGKWVILFGYAADFDPVSTTELMALAKMAPDFAALNAKLLALSIDSNNSHIAWLRTIKEKIEYNDMEKIEVGFPVIADTKMEVAKKYGLIQPGASEIRLARGVFFIDPEAKIRAFFYYPNSAGRNIQEIKRLLVAIQAADTHQIATPADWEAGDDVIVPTAGSYGDVKERMAKSSRDLNYLDWFICFKKMSKAELRQAPAATDKK